MWPSELSSPHCDHVNVKAVGRTRHHIFSKILFFTLMWLWKCSTFSRIIFIIIIIIFYWLFSVWDTLKRKNSWVGNEWKIGHQCGSYSKFFIADINKFFSPLCKYKLVNQINSWIIFSHIIYLVLKVFFCLFFYVSKQIPNFICS